jgi:hypothetical protein
MKKLAYQEIPIGISDLWRQGLGKTNAFALINRARAGSYTFGGFFQEVLLINAFQLLVSCFYLSVNTIISHQLVAAEWVRLLNTDERKALRVSSPQSQQRSSYMLSMPFAYSTPLMALGLVALARLPGNLHCADHSVRIWCFKYQDLLERRGKSWVLGHRDRFRRRDCITFYMWPLHSLFFQEIPKRATLFSLTGDLQCCYQRGLPSAGRRRRCTSVTSEHGGCKQTTGWSWTHGMVDFVV